MPAPAAPTGLTVLSQNGSVFLNWAAPTNNGGAAITDYAVQRRLASQPDTSFALVSHPVKATVGATITGVNGTSYVFRVAAVNKFGTGAYTANSAEVTPSNIPAAPAPPTCISSNGQVTINWNTPANNGAAITDYAIRRRVNGQATYTNLVDGISTATSYTNTGLTNGTGYLYSVAAINVKGASVWSADSAVVVPSTSPSAPNISVANTTFNSLTNTCLINLSWTIPTNNGSVITNYVIQGKLASGLDTSFTDLVSLGNVTTAAINPISYPALVLGNSYVFRVAAVNSKGRGNYSANSSSLTPSVAPSTASAPTATKGFGKVTLSWTAPYNGGSAITGYVIQRKISSQADTAYVSINTGSSTTYENTGLTNGVSYVFRIAAVNSRGRSNQFSPASQPVMPGVVLPNAPTNLVATVINDIEVTLTFTPPTDNGGGTISSYIVEAIENFGPFPARVPFTLSEVKLTSPNTLVVIGLGDVATSLSIQAVNEAGAGPNSNQTGNVTTSNKLFDKSSWRDAVASGGVSPNGVSYRHCLDAAADRWYKYIKYNALVKSQIASLVAADYQEPWVGIRLEPGTYLENDPTDRFYGQTIPFFKTFRDNTSTTIADSRPIGWAGYTSGGKNRQTTISMQLRLNLRYENAPADQWVTALTHELGHTLGIGQYWNSYYNGTPPVNSFLNGAVYTNAQAAYNSITVLGPSGVPVSRTKYPVENEGGSGSISSHWENNFRSDSAPSIITYPGLTDELMISTYPMGVPTSARRVISLLSIKQLVDFGWEERNPGASEGNPIFISSATSSARSQIINPELLCKCENRKHSDRQPIILNIPESAE